MNLWIVFLTGLTSGGLSCLAMQGGLLTSAIANQKDAELGKKPQPNTNPTSNFDRLDWLPVSLFLGTKLITHTILGFLLGALGSVISLSLEVRLGFQIFTVIFMFATAMNLLNVHPIFRYVVITPPRFVRKLLKNSTQSRALFTPAILGALTIFIPCGVTQAMEVVAINTGNPVTGALTMFAFVLGTSPIFGIVGVATAKLSEVWQKQFKLVAASVLIGMSLYGTNGVLRVIDSPLAANNLATSFDKLAKGLAGSQKSDSDGSIDPNVKLIDGVQKVSLAVTNQGYSPRSFSVKQGVPVELTLVTNNVYTCASAFRFKKFNIITQLKPTESKTFTFTPTETGSFNFSCAMGMYGGVMNVKS